VVGVWVGIWFLRRGFNLGRANRTQVATGWVMPILFVLLLIFVIFNASFLAESSSGVGSLHPAIWISLAVGLFIGFVAQRVRFCTMGGWRDLIMVKDTHLFLGLLGLVVGTLAANYLLGFFGDGGVATSTGIVAYHWGFTSQPIALPGVDAIGNIRWTDFLWDAGSMALVGLAAVLAGGCPLRQLVMSSEGDTDAGFTVIGMIVGSAIAMSFGFASNGAGPGALGPWALAVGLAVCLVLGFTMRERA
jgi:YedE family putative selenium metabolism protein